MSNSSAWINANGKAIFWWVVLLLLIYFPIFMDLGDLAMRTWDEPRMALNAFEITKDHNWIVTHYNGQIELWNTKPPLMMWIQALLIKIMGASELTIRLPSAISAALTCIMLVIFSQKFLKSFWTGFAAALVLVTTRGYIGIHSARTGDYDPIVTMFCTLYALSFFSYTETHKNKYLAITFVGLALALFTKGIAGAFFLPALFIYALIKKQVLPLLKNYRFYLFLILSLVPILGYYFWREQLNPGYMHAVWENELGGRYLSTIEEHKEVFWYYINNLIDWRYSYWLVFIAPGIALGLTNKDQKMKNITLYLSIIILFFVLLLSSAKTKLFWYDIPLYPLFAIIIGNMFKILYGYMKDYKESNPKVYAALKYGGLIPMFIYPYSAIIRSSYKPVETNDFDSTYYRIEYYMQKAERGQKNLDNYTLCYDQYEAAELFYIDILSDMGQHVKWVKKTDFMPGENVIVCEPQTEDSLKIKYTYQLIDSDHTVKAYHILDKRKK